MKTCKMSTAPEAVLEEVGDKGVITLNRPKALNALNYNMMTLIYPMLKEWENTKSMVIIKGKKMECSDEISLQVTVCSDRILTCRIKSICSPAKGGTGCYRFNYQPGS